MGANAVNRFKDGEDVVSWMGVRSSSGWATAGSSSDVDFTPGPGVGLDNGSGVGRRSSSKTFLLKSEAVNWVGVRGRDGTCSSGSVKVVETGEGGVRVRRLGC